MAYEFDTKVLGGLPVTIEFNVREYFDGTDYDWSIVAVAGKTCKKHPYWVTNKLTTDEEYRITEECHDQMGGW